MVSVGDLEALGQALRAEIPVIANPLIAAAKTDIDTQLRELNDRAVVEIQTMGQKLTQQQQEQQQQQTAQQAQYAAQQAQYATLQSQYGATVDAAVNAKFAAANENFIVEQTRTTELVEQLRREIATVHSGALEGLPARLLANENAAAGVAQTLHLSVESMRQDFLKWSAESTQRVAALERFANENSRGVAQGTGGGGGKGYQLRVPDPGSWTKSKMGTRVSIRGASHSTCRSGQFGQASMSSLRTSERPMLQ